MGYTLSFEQTLVITHIPHSMLDEEQLEYFERIEREVIKPRRRHASMVIAGQATVWTPEQRKRHHAFHKRNQAAIRELCVGSALVMPEVSIVVRFALSTMMMLSPGAAATIFHDESKARLWLQGVSAKAMRPAPVR